MQIMTSPAFGKKHPWYTGKWHGHSQQSSLSWLRRWAEWSGGDHHQPARPGKMAKSTHLLHLTTWYNSTLYPCCPSCHPWFMAFLFQSMTAALMKNCELNIGGEGLDRVHCIHLALVREDPKVAAPLLATAGAFKRMSHGNSNALTSAELSNIQKTNNNFEKLSRFSLRISSGCPDVISL